MTLQFIKFQQQFIAEARRIKGTLTKQHLEGIHTIRSAHRDYMLLHKSTKQLLKKEISKDVEDH